MRARVDAEETRANDLLHTSVGLRSLAAEIEERALALETNAVNSEAAARVEADTGRGAVELRSRVADLMRRIEEAKAGPAAEISALDAQIAALDLRAREAEASQAAVDASKRAQHRVEELRAAEKTLAQAIESIDREVFLCESFVRAKVRLLEGRINLRFGIARFRLFKELVNGGLEECCDVSLGGVPYSSLNHGSRLNVGLDVINTIAGHVGFAPPIFIDNAESVTDILPTIGQQIRLVVSEPDKTLRVERQAMGAVATL